MTASTAIAYALMFTAILLFMAAVVMEVKDLKKEILRLKKQSTYKPKTK